MPKTCSDEAAGRAGMCARQCCAYCLADAACVQARLIGTGCHLVHLDPKTGGDPGSKGSVVGILNQFGDNGGGSCVEVAREGGERAADEGLEVAARATYRLDARRLQRLDERVLWRSRMV